MNKFLQMLIKSLSKNFTAPVSFFVVLFLFIIVLVVAFIFAMLLLSSGHAGEVLQNIIKIFAK